MNEQENQNPNPELDASRTSAASGEGAVDHASLTLAELNQVLGKDFKDKESALKSLKDTNSYVGKSRQEIAELQSKVNAGADESVKKELQALKESVFYSENPQYKPYADVLRRMGGTEAVESPEFKKVFELGQKATEADARKSVVSSNSRIATDPSVYQKAVAVANDPNMGTTEVAGVFAAEILKELGS